MSTLTVSGDFSYAGAPTGVDTLEFINPAANTGTVTFASTDFDDVRVLRNLLIKGSAGGDGVVVNGSSLDASGWTFADWAGIDSIALNGTDAIANTIVGSSQKDTITGTGTSIDTFTGGGGADTLIGGTGNDLFIYTAVTDAADFEVVNGGGGVTDTIRLGSFSGSINFFGMTISGVERLEFAGGAISGIFKEANFGFGTVIGDASINRVTVNGNADLSGVNFANWTDGTDEIFLNGNALANTMTGSAKADRFLGNIGVDVLAGLAGNDRFLYTSGLDLAGETVDGGADTDSLSIQGGGAFDFSATSLTSIEAISFVGPAATVTFVAGQIGAGAIASVTGTFSTQTIIVNAAAGADLSSLTFASWTAGDDRVVLNGSGANNSLVGSIKDDEINGLALADFLVGGAGNDTLNGGDDGVSDTLSGGSGNDTYVLGDESESVIDSSGKDTITSTINRSLANFAAIENLTLQGAALKAAGNDLANILTGNGKANVLNGGAGLDSLRGGGGKDTYVLGNGNDGVIDTAGVDLITSTKSRSLGAYATVENLTLLGNGAINGTGNKLANALIGNAKANVLNGGLGNDKITGGVGKDTLTGAAGNDTFIYKAVAESRGANVDVIRDFDDRGNDRVDFSALIAGKLAFKGLNAFTGIKQVHINDIAGPDVLVEVNLSGSIAPEVIVRLAGTPAALMTESDFIL